MNMSFPISFLFDQDTWDKVAVWYIYDIENKKEITLPFTQHQVFGNELAYATHLNISSNYAVRVPLAGKIIFVDNK